MKVVLSGNLMRFTDYQKEVDLAASTVQEALEQVVDRFPDLKPVVFDGEGGVRAVHRLYLNGDVIDPSDVGQGVEDDDELGILTALAGG